MALIKYCLIFKSNDFYVICSEIVWPIVHQDSPPNPTKLIFKLSRKLPNKNSAQLSRVIINIRTSRESQLQLLSPVPRPSEYLHSPGLSMSEHDLCTVPERRRARTLHCISETGPATQEIRHNIDGRNVCGAGWPDCPANIFSTPCMLGQQCLCIIPTASESQQGVCPRKQI